MTCERSPLLAMAPADFVSCREGLNKDALVKLVRRQFDLWPKEEYKWAPKRDTTVKVLKQVLLDPQYCFCKIGKSIG
jgi:hypothetical protein